MRTFICLLALHLAESHFKVEIDTLTGIGLIVFVIVATAQDLKELNRDRP